MSINTTLAGLSNTASGNGTDGAVDAPSTLDDSIRYALSFVAQLRDGTVSGVFTSYTSAGTLTAYSITPSPAIGVYAAFQSFMVKFHVASGASPTLAISGIATPPALVRRLQDGSYQNIIAGEIAAGFVGRVTLVSTTQALVEGLDAKTVGTVSQALGVPTGSVIETGTNANGTYTRFADGSQICTMGFPDIACPASAYVSLANRSYPAAFIATPAMSYSCNPQTTYDFFGFVASNASLASCQPVIRNGGTAQNAILIYAVAVGRWF